MTSDECREDWIFASERCYCDAALQYERMGAFRGCLHRKDGFIEGSKMTKWLRYMMSGR